LKAEEDKMSAAAITPTSVTVTYLYGTQTYGSAAPKRYAKCMVVLTKVTQSDWFVSDTYLPAGDVIKATGFDIDSSGDGAAETMTYTASGTLVIMGGATVGTAYIEVIVALD